MTRSFIIAERRSPGRTLIAERVLDEESDFPIYRLKNVTYKKFQNEKAMLDYCRSEFRFDWSH